MNEIKVVLVIYKEEYWGLFSLRLYLVTGKDFYFALDIPLDKVVSTDSSCQVDALESVSSRLQTICLQTGLDYLYRHVGKKYPSRSAFFKTEDKGVQTYVKQLSDKYIDEALRLAHEADVPIFMGPRHEGVLYFKDVLTLEPSAAEMSMKFVCHDDKIDYQLVFKDGLVPSTHKTAVISHEPSWIVSDNRLFTLGKDISGKLVLPFLKSQTVTIPMRVKDDYFRKFILRNAYRLDIDAEGFDVEELYPQPAAFLRIEHGLFGKYTLSLLFTYGRRTIARNYPYKRIVMLEDRDDGVRFVMTHRDMDAERRSAEYVYGTLSMPAEGPATELIEWLGTHNKELTGHGITVEQRMDKVYYIGDVVVNRDDKRAGDWFDVHIVLCFDDGLSLPLVEMRDVILGGVHEFLLPSGNWFIIPDSWLAVYGPLLLFGHKNPHGGLRIHVSQRGVLETAESDGLRQPDSEEGNRRPFCRYDLPKSLHATLRPYQADGFRWLVGHFLAGEGCCLGDDMGLGKTVQAISLMLWYKERCAMSAHKSCYALPKADETGQYELFSFDSPAKDNALPEPGNVFSGQLSERGNTVSEHGNAFSAQLSDRDNIVSESLPEHGNVVLAQLSDGESFKPILVLSPASVTYNWRSELQRFAPSMRVLEYTGTTEARKRLRRRIPSHDVVLTTYQTLRNDIGYFADITFGIIVFDESQQFKNSDSQLYAAVSRLKSGHLLALSGTPMENNLSELWSLMHLLCPGLLGEAAVFRRHFIIPISNNLYSEKTMMLRTLTAPFFLRRLRSDVLDSLPDRTDEWVHCSMSEQQRELYETELSCMRNLILEGKANRPDTMNVLKAITRLRQAANCPELLEENVPSGKMEAVFERLEQLWGTGHKALVFSEYVSVLDIVAREMNARGWHYERLTGETTDREGHIAHFQQDGTCRFFLISLKAGGVGLNLTEADYVFLVDPWWNRTAEEQAISRAHRMGQQRGVMVYRFITDDTIEEKIVALQNRKQSMIDAVLACVENGDGPPFPKIGEKRS